VEPGNRHALLSIAFQMAPARVANTATTNRTTPTATAPVNAFRS
jgi:hypothetical protein